MDSFSLLTCLMLEKTKDSNVLNIICVAIGCLLSKCQHTGLGYDKGKARRERGAVDQGWAGLWVHLIHC